MISYVESSDETNILKFRYIIIKRLLKLYCEIFDNDSYGVDPRRMNSFQIFHNINSITCNFDTTFSYT